MKKLLSTLIILFLFSFKLFSQQQVLGPHGGNLSTVHGYKIEMVACSEYFEVYLFNLALDPILNKGISGTVVYAYKSKAQTKADLVHYGVDGFSVLGGDEGFTSCVLTLVIDGRPIAANFDNNFVCTDR